MSKTATATAETPKPNLRPLALGAGRVTEPGQKHQTWNARIPDAEWDHLMQPTYFGVRYAMHIHAGDTVRCYNESATRWCELYVAATTPHGASIEMRMIHHGEMEAAQHEHFEDATHKIEWCGLSKRYCIFQKSNNAMLAENIGSMADARYRLATDHNARKVG